MIGGAAGECRKETRIGPDPVVQPLYAGTEAAPTDTHEDCHFVASGNPVTDFRLGSEVMNKACTI